MGTLEGEVAVVTGAGRGIAQKLAEEGAAVALWDVNAAVATTAAHDLSEQKASQTLAVEVDVSDTGSVDCAAGATARDLGPVTILVNNAGIASPGLLWETSDEEWDRNISVNLSYQFRCTRAVIKGMVEQKRGSIVNISSISAQTGRPNSSAPYSAAKGGVVSLTFLTAAQGAPYGVRANGICPGSIPGEIHRSFSEDQFAQIRQGSYWRGRGRSARAFLKTSARPFGFSSRPHLAGSQASS